MVVPKVRALLRVIKVSFCRQKHCHRNENFKIGPWRQETWPKTKGKRPTTQNTDRNSETLPRPKGFLHQSPDREATLHKGNTAREATGTAVDQVHTRSLKSSKSIKNNNGMARPALGRMCASTHTCMHACNCFPHRRAGTDTTLSPKGHDCLDPRPGPPWGGLPQLIRGQGGGARSITTFWMGAHALRCNAYPQYRRCSAQKIDLSGNLRFRFEFGLKLGQTKTTIRNF